MQLLEPFKKKYHSAFESKIITDPTTKLSKGYGFVQFSNYEESQKAITEMQGFMIRGKPIKVSPGFSRNSINPGSNNTKGAGSNQSKFGSNLDGLNGPGGVFALGAGTMLGGLGVQIKTPDNPNQASLVGMAAQNTQFAFIPGQNQAALGMGFHNPGLAAAQGLYSQSIADQQKLLYYQVLLGSQNLGSNPQAAQLLSLASQAQGFPGGMQMNPANMYGAAGMGLVGGRFRVTPSKSTTGCWSALPDHATAGIWNIWSAYSRKPLGNTGWFRCITAVKRTDERRTKTDETCSESRSG